MRTPASAVPRSIPVAVKVTGLAKLNTPRAPIPVGSASNTYEGMVNCSSPTGATQIKLALTPVASDEPEINTKVPEAPPVQVISWPFDSVTEEIEFSFVQVRGTGRVMVTLKGPTFFPP